MTRLATPQGTARYAAAYPAAEGHYREALGLKLSSVGFGSYLGDETDAADSAYAESFAVGLASGVNVFDTAANYRARRSERALGRALAKTDVPRDGFLVATKGGFVPFDAAGGEAPATYFERNYVDTGICTTGDLVSGCHVMTPRYLSRELDESLRNLSVDGVDVYFVHNPETQLTGGVPRRAFTSRLRSVFEMLEERRRRGHIGVYGLATWNAMRLPPAHPQHIGLEEALCLAEEVAGADHGLRALELPYNLGMPEAAAVATQPWNGRLVPALGAAKAAGMLVLGSASLLQTRLLGRIDAQLRADMGTDDDAHAALQFARSTPGVTSALVGTGRPEHAVHNARVRTLEARPDVVARLLPAG